MTKCYGCRFFEYCHGKGDYLAVPEKLLNAECKKRGVNKAEHNLCTTQG